jgi:superfamily II helicase
MSAQFQNPLPSSGHRIGARSNRACTTCRQVKLRCDSAQTFPSPCSRCKRGNLQCRIDPDFKRTRARHQLNEVTSQLIAIQKTLEMNSATSSPNARPPSSTSWGESWRGSRVADPSTRVHRNDLTSTNEDSFYKMSSSEDLPNSSVSLGSAVLERENLIVLFAQ